MAPRARRHPRGRGAVRRARGGQRRLQLYIRRGHQTRHDQRRQRRTAAAHRPYRTGLSHQRLPRNLWHLLGPTGFASVTNTDRIVVNGTASTDLRDGFIIEQSQGALGPGATPESDGNSELEVQIRQQVANPARLQIVGTTQADTIRVAGVNAVNLGNDGDVDINIFRADGNAPRAARVDIDGNLGDDFISGRGLFPGATGPSAGPATVRLFLEGRAGNDTLVDGLAADTLNGDFGNQIPGPGVDTGDDTLFSVDGVRDTLAGGPGFDTATTDAGDDVSSVDQRTIGSVGRLRLTPAAVRARAGGVARMTLGWTHPKSWRKLRSLELRLILGTEPVGRVLVEPATDGVRARGAVGLAGGSRVEHHGKTVTAKLAVRPAKSLAGERLRLDVQATDRRGRTQLEPAAGTIAVR
jgi:hypothetical protein